MKTLFAVTAIAAALGLAAPGAQAAGCIRGALVGGVAGHYAGHHTLLGAAGGCLVGRRLANQSRERELERQNAADQFQPGQQQGQYPQGQYPQGQYPQGQVQPQYQR